MVQARVCQGPSGQQDGEVQKHKTNFPRTSPNKRAAEDMLVVLLRSPATTRGAQGGSHTKAHKSGSLTGDQDKPPEPTC